MDTIGVYSVTGGSTYFDKLYRPVGVMWLSGYVIPDSNIYVAQLGLACEDQDKHDVFRHANIDAFLEGTKLGEKIAEISKKNGHKLRFQMVPHKPGFSYIVAFMEMGE